MIDGVNRDAAIIYKDMGFQWEAHEQLPDGAIKETWLVTHPSAPSGRQAPGRCPTGSPELVLRTRP